jgi:hypothetical protein
VEYSLGLRRNTHPQTDGFSNSSEFCRDRAGMSVAPPSVDGRQDERDSGTLGR